MSKSGFALSAVMVNCSPTHTLLSIDIQDLNVINFIHKFRVFFILTSCALIIFGIHIEATGGNGGIILFTPGVLLGLLIFLTHPNKKQPNLTPEPNSLADELLKWHKLKELGVITDEEFLEKKRELMN